MPGLLVVAILVAAPFADGVARAEKAYTASEWDAALRELTIAEKFAETDAERVTVLLCEGLVMANLPNDDAAAAAWLRALPLDDAAQLPWLATPRIAESFERLRRVVRDTKAAAKPEAPAAPRAVDAPARRPPVLPIFSGALAVVSFGTALTFGVIASDSSSRARTAEWEDERVGLVRSAQSSALTANVLYGVAAAFALTALLTWLLMG